MMHHERENTQETVAQRFMDYVVTHSTPATEQSPDDVVRRGCWKVHIPLPLLRDTIEAVTCGVNKAIGEEDFVDDEHTYDIVIKLSSGSSALFSHDSRRPLTPYTYYGIDDEVEAIHESDIVNLLSDLNAYEASGQMIRIEPAG